LSFNFYENIIFHGVLI